MNTETFSNGSDLWSFSVRLYGKAGVKEACLSLQSRAGLDVCVLLSACWSAQIHADAWEQSDVEEILLQCDAWRKNVVLPLRSVRDFLKASDPDKGELRKSVLALELSAERQQLELIERILSDKGRASDLHKAHKAEIAAQNLKFYLAAVTSPETSEALTLQKDLQVLIDTAFEHTTDSSPAK